MGFFFLHSQGAPHLTTAPSFWDLHFWFVTKTNRLHNKPQELLWTLICSMLSLFSSAGQLPELVRRWTWPWWGEQTQAQGSCRGTGGCFTPPSSHTPDLPTQFLPFHHPRHRAAFWSPGPHCVPWDHHGLWVGLCTLGTGCPHPHSLSKLQVPTLFSNLHWHERTLPRFEHQIFGKEKAVIPPSLPPSLPAQVQQGQCWQALAEGGSIPKKQQENLKSQQTRRLQPAEGLSDTQLQVKAASLPDSLSLIKRLVITHLPVKVYPYTCLFGYFIHKTLNKMPFFFVPTF